MKNRGNFFEGVPFELVDLILDRDGRVKIGYESGIVTIVYVIYYAISFFSFLSIGVTSITLHGGAADGLTIFFLILSVLLTLFFYKLSSNMDFYWKIDSARRKILYAGRVSIGL